MSADADFIDLLRAYAARERASLRVLTLREWSEDIDRRASALGIRPPCRMPPERAR